MDPRHALSFELVHKDYGSHYFEEYDYGVKGNLKHYGQEWPPFVNIGHIKDIAIGIFVDGFDRWRQRLIRTGCETSWAQT